MADLRLPVFGTPDSAASPSLIKAWYGLHYPDQATDFSENACLLNCGRSLQFFL